MSVLIQVGVLRASQLAKFEEGRWIRVGYRCDANLIGGLNESLRREPIPDDCPDPDRYALDLAKKYLPSLQVLHFGPKEEIDPEKLPKWLRFFLNR